MAEQLITALSMTWDPTRFHDTFQEKVATLIDAEQAGESVEKAEPAAEPTGAVDLMEALRASVERAARPKSTGGKTTAPKKEDLDGLSKAALYKKAAAAHLPDRSNMTRNDLLKALTLTRRHRRPLSTDR
ncbi:hypothetical protein [Streptomyces sp. Isolate_45]|uniref:hypothetical protein n=1 Tax=Streptomyces sp. Isolate_45 TaxID=2950111 RepID=UPI0024820BFA|nr:hypothetical protein [Streptomyces sp. Isolate_45]MDA5284125.1 hypothetical protein [Streptomyces sp. Isolate_45]